MGSNTRASVVQATTLHGAKDVRVFSKMARTLVSAGYEVTILHPGPDLPSEAGVSFRGLNLRGPRFWRRVTGGLKVWQYCRRKKPAVVQFHDPELIPWAIVWALSGNISVYDAHEDSRLNILHREWIPRVLRPMAGRLVALVERLAASTLSAIVAATEPIAKRFEGARVVVIRNFPEDLDLFLRAARPFSERENVGVYAGTMRPDRGHHRIISAASLVDPKLGFRLKLAGRIGALELTDVEGRKPPATIVSYLGELTRSDVMRLMGEARIGLQLIEPLPHFLESLPLKIFEYMAAGTPVVVSDFPAWREIVEQAQCGLVVNPLSPEAIAGAIEELLRDPVAAEAMGRNGQQAVARLYSWSTERERLLGLYKDLLAARGTL